MRRFPLALFAALSLIVSLAAAADDVRSGLERVSALRGHAFPHRVKQKTISRSDLRRFLTERMQTDLPLPPSDYVAALRVLKLLPPGKDPLPSLLDLYESQVLAFYDPRSATFYSLDTPPAAFELGSGFERAIEVHELTHALQDQLFHAGDRMEALKSDWDGQLAYQSLLEGEATLVMLADLGADLGVSLDDLVREDDIMQMIASMNSAQIGIPDDAPKYFVSSMTFPYSEGLKYVIRAYRKGGWSAIDAIHRNPPLTTSEILHPGGVASKPLDELGFSAFGRPLMQTRLGEFHWRFLLGPAAAEGWRADEVAIFRGANGSLTVLGVTRWAGPADAIEFAEALSRIYGPDEPEVRLKGSEVRFGFGPDRAAIERFVGLEKKAAAR